MRVVPSLKEARNLDAGSRDRLANFVVRWSPRNKSAGELFRAELTAAINEYNSYKYKEK